MSCSSNYKLFISAPTIVSRYTIAPLSSPAAIARYFSGVRHLFNEWPMNEFIKKGHTTQVIISPNLQNIYTSIKESGLTSFFIDYLGNSTKNESILSLNFVQYG